MSKTWYYGSDKEIFADPFFKEFNILFKNALQNQSDFVPFSSAMKMPYPANIWYNEEYVGIEIPILKGKSEDIEITKTNDTLRIKYVRSNRGEDSKVQFVQRGIVERDFDFSWKIPSKVDYSGIQSVFENGLLTIYLPIAKEAKPQKVEILNTGENWKKIALREKLGPEAEN